ncbi:hypothetical protein EX30DRAFT_338638 [Ascodesmis nigricans]|uniref:Uncharacterized protein n=1 Tax=Ascodesmis nigricans TaxID=341454 RepID=A0A4S2N4D5_9PEZI|nr:hypothetical protein EX30DRAFT_338638 [Ascodesmis nigricans]
MFRGTSWASDRPPDNMQVIHSSPGPSGSNSSEEHINTSSRRDMTIRERRMHLKGSQIKSISIDTGQDVPSVSKFETRSSGSKTSTWNSSSHVSSSCYSLSPTSANGWVVSPYSQYCLITSMTTPLPLHPGNGRFDAPVTAELRTPSTASSIYSEHGSPIPTEASSKPSSPVITSSRVLEKDFDDYIHSRIRSLELLGPYWQNDELRGVSRAQRRSRVDLLDEVDC